MWTKYKINKYFDDNYIVLHIRTGDDLKKRGLTQNNINLLILKLNKFELTKKVIIITALHYGHSKQSNLFQSKKYIYNQKNYTTNIQNIHKLILYLEIMFIWPVDMSILYSNQ